MPFTTPAHLKILGTEVCKDCGKTMSIENTVCYGCGFQKDDEYINEEALNRKYSIGNEMIYSLYLVSSDINKKGSVPRYHLMKNDFTLCGSAVSRRNKFEQIGLMKISRVPILYRNPCAICLERLENEKM